MSATLSAHDDMHVMAWQARRGASQTERKPVSRRRRQLTTLVRVPMLDWASDLFSDNVSQSELMEWEMSGPEFAGMDLQAAA